MELYLATARIEKANGSTVGSGIVISRRHVLTCAHVVAYALDKDVKTTDKPQEKVSLKFPAVDSSKPYEAHVICWYPVISNQTIKDICILELTEDIPVAISPVKIKSSQDYHIQDHEFSAFGFPEKSTITGAYTEGKIIDRVVGNLVQIEGTKATGLRIQPGYSGSAIFDKDLRAVIGMAVRENINNPASKVAYMIPTETLIAAWPPLLDNCVKEDTSLKEITETLEQYENILVKDFDSVYSLVLGTAIGRLEKELKLAQKLEDLSQRRKHGFSQLARLVTYLYLEQKKSGSNLTLTDQLEQWLEKYTQKHDLIQHVKEEFDGGEQMWPKKFETALIIQFTQKTSGYVANAWLIENLQSYLKEKRSKISAILKEQSLPSLTQEAIKEITELIRQRSYREICKEDYQGENIKKIFFCFPSLSIFKKDLKVSELDYWLEIDKRNTRIGEKHQVFLSVLEYREKLDPEAIFTWKKKNQALIQSMSMSALAYLKEEDHLLKRFFQNIDEDEVAAIRLRKSLTLSKCQETIETCLDAGIPLIIWTRKNIDKTSRNSQQALVDLCTNCTVEELPEKIRACRKAGYGDKNSLGQNLTVLWDDQELAIPNIQKRALQV